MAMSPRLLRPRATGFNPNTISNLLTWWDFNDLSTLAQNSDGTGPSTATNDRVAFVIDKAGSRNLSQSNNNLCGSLALASINGRNTVVMPSTSGARYDIPAGTLSSANFFGNAQTFFLVAQYTGANNWIAAFNNRSNFFVDSAQASSGDNAWFGTSTTPTYRVNGSALSPTVTRGALRTALGLSSRYLLSVSNITPSVTGLGLPGVGGTTFGLAGFGSTSTFIGNFCEFVWYNRNLTAGEIAATEKYLKAKWGTP